MYSSTYILFMKTIETVENVFGKMNWVLMILDRAGISGADRSFSGHCGSFSMSSVPGDELGTNDLATCTEARSSVAIRSQFKELVRREYR